LRSLEFDIAALEDLAWWTQQDRNKALRIVSLIKEIHRDRSEELASRNRSNMK